MNCYRCSGRGCIFCNTPIKTKTVPADAIVILREELPEVTPRADRNVMCDGIEFSTSHTVIADDYREIGARALAVAEYLDAHPPVDEAQVKALAEVIDASDITEFETCTDYARRLYLAGVRIEAAK